MITRLLVACAVVFLIPARAQAQAPDLSREYIYLNGRVVAVENAGALWPGGGGNQPIAVDVRPGTASLAPGQQLQFVSVVTGAADQGVTWTTDPIIGNITSSGLYTAPATVSRGQTVTIRAISRADPTKSAYATVKFYSPQATGDYPLLGSFLNFYRNLTPELWAKEYDLMAQINMNTIVVFSVGLLRPDSSDSTGYSLSGEGLLYPSSLVDPSIRPTTDRLEMILSLADQRGMKVYLGSLQTSGDWSTGVEFSALRKYNRLVTQEILTRYGQHQSLEGWFFSQELWLNWVKAYGPDYYGTTLLANFVADMRALDATKPVSAAVVFKQTGDGTMPGLTPAELQSTTTTFLQRSGVQILMPQDGAGAEAGAPPLADLPAYFQALKLAVDAAGTGATLWSTVETFTAVPNVYSVQYPPATANRVQQQVNNVRPYVTGYVSWIFGDDMSPQATYYPIDASGLNRNYQSKFQPDTHPTLVAFTPLNYISEPQADPNWPDSGGELINRTGGGYSGYNYSDWAGWWETNTGNHLKVTIDVGSIQWIRMIRALSMSQLNSGIYHPQQMLVEVSTDGQNYSTMGTALQTWPNGNDFSIGWTELSMVATGRYVRLTFSHVWWIFLNELEVLGIAGAPQPPPGSGVTVSPSSISLLAGQSQQFSATVTGSGNQAVTWSQTPEIGSISSTGVYTAPASITGTQQITIQATSVADPTKTGTATVVLNAQSPSGISVSVDPSSVALLAGQTQQFTASVTGTSNTAVTWSLTSPVGALSSSGLYSAPTAVTTRQSTMVRATSAADPSQSATAAVTIDPDPTLLPMVGPVTPDSGTGFSQVFQFNARARSGELDTVWIVINATLDASHACFIQYNPGDGDLIALSADDSSNDYYSWAGIKALGEPGQLSNSQCTIDTGASSVTRNGTAVQLNLSITFKPAFEGTQHMYMAAQDTGGNLTSWPYVGYWDVP